MTFVLLVGFEALRLGLRTLLLVLVVHLVRAALSSRRRRDPSPDPRSDPERWPVVTVQLPIRDEYYVVERVIAAACELDYPRDHLEIQVLDDSSDATAARVLEIVERRRAAGYPVTLLQRQQPEGYKAGALAHGLRHARGELVAIFDADCVPPADFLRRTVPRMMDDDGVACVQVRWSFLNRADSLLTRVQAIVLDGLFAVDQFTRAAMSLPFQFNGTNGIWRRQAIADAGGWNGKMLAEDADLSFRAQLRGWRLVHLRDYAVPTEIPANMAAFRAQQRRWALGSAQLLRSMSTAILRAPISLRAKTMMFMHLGRHSLDPLILMACLSSPFTTLYGMPYLVDYGVAANAGLVALILCACLLFYGVALRTVGADNRNLLLVPFVVALALGLSLVYTVAMVRGLVQRGGAFVRTPKAGEPGSTEGPTYRSPVDALILLEVGLGTAHLWFAAQAFGAGTWPYGCFFLAVAASFLWVGLGSLQTLVRPRSSGPGPSSPQRA